MLIDQAVQEFLAELAHADRSRHTMRAYASDLAPLAGLADALEQITPADLRQLAAEQSHLSPATRARRQAALSSFFRWLVREGRIPSNPVDRLERVRRAPPMPRGLTRKTVESILGKIPPERHRDRLLFRLVFETGIRIGEALGMHVEDLELDPDDERLVVLGKGGRRRTVLLDDPELVKQLKAYLKRTGYKHGPLFRAEVNGRGGALRHQSAYALWQRYCRAAGIECTIHQLRHSHATELVRGGVSLATIRKRLGHRSLQTTLLYAEQSDARADVEIRAWRRARKP
jgi:site-specific recombinase XerD